MSSINPNSFNLESDLTNLMDGMLKVAMVCYPETPEVVMRSKIVAQNLKALVDVILLGDHPDTPIKVNLKMVCLGLLAAADWLDPEEVQDALRGDEGLS